MPSKLIEASLRNSICENCASFKMENDLVWPLRDNLYLEKTKKYFSFKIFRFSCSSFSFFLIFFPFVFGEEKKKYFGVSFDSKWQKKRVSVSFNLWQMTSVFHIKRGKTRVPKNKSTKQRKAMYYIAIYCD